MKQNAITYEQSCALIIMTTHEMGCDVSMLAAAESVIKDKRSVDPCSILEFERASCAAHEVIRQQGVDAIRKANEICNRLKEEYIFNQ